jgi:hypothetical protein
MLGAFALRFMVRPPRVVTACMVVLLGLVGPVGAEPVGKDAKVEAKAHFVSGQSHYNLNEFPEALADFKDAYRLFPDPVFLYNLGQCERQLGHHEEAIRFYRSFLREQPKAPNRQEVTHKIEEMEAAIKNRSPDPVVVPTGDAAKTEPAVAPPAAAATAPMVEASSLAEVAAKPAPVSAPSYATMPEAAGVDLSSKPTEPAPAASPSFYQHWWFWPAVAVVAIGAGVGIYAATTAKGTGEPTTDLGTRKAF